MSTTARDSGSATTDRLQVRSGLKWVSLSMALSRSSRFITTVVLARLLAKEMFGIFAVANAVLHLLGSVREVGLGQAYIQRVDQDEDDARRAASTTFWLLMLSNGALFAVACSLSPWIAELFRDPEGAVEPHVLRTVLQVLFATVLITPFSNVSSVVLQKRLEFAKASYGQIGRGLTYAGVAIPLAFLGFGLWSLVIGRIGGHIVATGLLLRLSRWRPRVEFDRAAARQLFGFGKHLWGFSILTAVNGFFDRLLIGKLVGLAAAGLYGVAFNLCNTPTTQVAHLVNRIAFPAMSRIQNDPDRMRRAFVKALSHLSVLTLPIALGLHAVAPDFVPVVYGEKWTEAVPIVRVLAFYGLVLSISSVGGPALKAIGRPQVLLWTSVMFLAVMFGLFWLLAGYGAVGIAWAVVVPVALSAGVAFWVISACLEIPPRTLLEPIIRAGTAAATMWIAVVLLRAVALGPIGLPRAGVLPLEIGAGAAVYVAVSFVVNGERSREFLGTMREVARPGRRQRPGSPPGSSGC